MARYPVSELFYYFGFAIGAGVAYKAALRFGVTNSWVALGLALVGGMGVGVLVERLHQGPSRPPYEGP